jgi:phosphopantetheinyl transferase (holo-ACP synthase)
MPIFFQQDIDGNSRLAIWKIEEGEEFFSRNVPLQQDITHPHKRLQHLAGRYLLQWLFPGFPIELIQIADTKKPFLEDEAYHFSISHCGDYAAAIVSRTDRVGIDIEIPSEKVVRILGKFLHPEESELLACWNHQGRLEYPTLLWCAKESMFKWWGLGKVDFSEMLRLSGNRPGQEGSLNGNFRGNGFHAVFPVHFRMFPSVMLAWVKTEGKEYRISPPDCVTQAGSNE